MDFYLDAWRNFANFSGRATRQQYWMFILINLIIAFILGFIDSVFGTYSEEAGIGLLGGIYTLAVLVPSIAILIRRLHDTSRSGWWLLLFLIPIIGPLALLVFAILDSTAEENQWGPSIKYANQTEMASA